MIKFRSVCSLAAAVLMFGSSSAAQAAACSVPTAPDPTTKPEKPAQPVKSACVDKPSGPGCMGWEPYRFNEDVKAYNAKAPAYQKAANDYVAKLNAYVAGSVEYAKCEMKALQ